MPILPGLNDSESALDRLARRAAQAGARSLHANILFLMPSAMRQFMPFLEREFPRLVARYRKLYARSAYLNGEYKERMRMLVSEIRARHGLASRDAEPKELAPRAQLMLHFPAAAASGK